MSIHSYSRCWLRGKFFLPSLKMPAAVTKSCVERWSRCSGLTGMEIVSFKSRPWAAKMIAQEKPESLVGQQVRAYQILSC